MNLDPNLTGATLDHNSITCWAHAMNLRPSTVFLANVENVLDYAVKHDAWFMPDMDEEGCVVSNDRLEQFRLACLYETLDNLHDIGLHLDDDPTDSLAFYARLTANDHDDRNAPSWLTYPFPYSITWRTHSYPHVHTW